MRHRRHNRPRKSLEIRSPELRARELEQRVSRALEELPLQRAPRTLESRVLARIETDTAPAAPRGLFAAWAFLPRAVFLSISLGCAAAALLAWPWVAPHARFVGLGRPAIAAMPATATALLEGGRWLLGAYRALPRDWLYAGLLVGTTLYAMLIGLTVSALRTLARGVSVEARGS